MLSILVLQLALGASDSAEQLLCCLDASSASAAERLEERQGRGKKPWPPLVLALGATARIALRRALGHTFWCGGGLVGLRARVDAPEVLDARQRLGDAVQRVEQRDDLAALQEVWVEFGTGVSVALKARLTRGPFGRARTGS